MVRTKSFSWEQSVADKFQTVVGRCSKLQKNSKVYLLMFLWVNRSFLRFRIVQHIIFWVSIVVFFSVLWGSFNEDYLKQFKLQLIYLPDKVIPTYITLYILMPLLLLKEKYTQFVFWLIIVLFISGFLHWSISFYIERPLYYNDEDWGAFMNLAKIIKGMTYVYPYVLVAFVIKFLKHWYKQQKQTQDLLKGKLEAELKFLKTQLHPHFLFNTLNNLYALTLKKSDAAPELVLKLSDLMDYMLYECDAARVPLERELSFVNNYFEIEKLRYGGRLQVGVNVQGNPKGRNIAPLIFLPFLENAFKHGISKELEDAWIKFDLIIDVEKLELTVSNSKSQEYIEIGKNNGIGLQNVKRRLELQYGLEGFTLTTESGNAYFTVKLGLAE